MKINEVNKIFIIIYDLCFLKLIYCKKVNKYAIGIDITLVILAEIPHSKSILTLDEQVLLRENK